MSLHYALLPSQAAVMAVRVGVRSIPAPLDGTLTRLSFSIGQANAAGAATFDFRVGGVSVFGPGPRPSIPAGQTRVTVSGLELEVSEGDVLSWDAVSVPVGGLSAPVTCTAVLDDGQAAGIEVASTSGSPDVAAVSKLVVGAGDLTDLGGGQVRVRTYADMLATLLVGGKLDPALLPVLAITDKFVAASEAAMLALAAQQGDVAFRTDVSEVYLLAGTDPTVLSNWVQWLHPAIPTSLPPTGTAGGDLDGTYPAPSVEKLKRRSMAGIPDIPGFFEDDFDDNALNLELWTVTGGVTESSQRLNVPNGDDALTALSMDMTGHYIIFKTIQTQDGIFRIYVNGPGDLHMDVRVQPNAIGMLRLTTHDAGGDTHNNYAYSTLAEWAWLRVRHDNSAHLWYLDSAPDIAGAPGVWVNRAAAASPAGMTGLTTSTVQIFGQGAFWIDEISSDAPLADPIVGKNLYSINWDSPNSRFALMHLFGAVDVLSSAPSAPPAGWPAGVGWLGCVGNTLYMWDGSAMHSQVF